MVWISVFTPWMWMNIIGPHIAKGPTDPTSKNQLNHQRMDLNGLPNTMKKWINKWERGDYHFFLFFFFFFLCLVSFFITSWPLKVLKIASYKGKKKAQESRKEPPISKVGFYKLYYFILIYHHSLNQKTHTTISFKKPCYHL